MDYDLETVTFAFRQQRHMLRKQIAKTEIITKLMSAIVRNLVQLRVDEHYYRIF